MPFETLGEYNRRVESVLRSGVTAAIQRSGPLASKAPKVAKRKRSASPVQEDEKPIHRSALPKRLNDVVQAPPTLVKMRRAVESGAGQRGGVSLGLQREMEKERDRVVKGYRDLKAKREEARVTLAGGGGGVR